MDEARRALRRTRRTPPAARIAHRLSVPARRGRGRRSRPGRVRQGFRPYRHRIARRGRSKSGSPAFSSTAASIGGKRAPAATAGSRRPTRPARRTKRGWPLAARPNSDPEARLLARERRARLAAAIDRLDGRQRTVFMLCHYGDCTPREVSAMTGLNESTVRVHLFRAARKLRGAPRRQAVIGRAAPSARRSAVRVLLAKPWPASRDPPPAVEHLADCASCRDALRRAAAFMDRHPLGGRRRERRDCSPRIGCASSRSRSCAGSSTWAARRASSASRAASRAISPADAPRRAALAGRRRCRRTVRRRRRRRRCSCSPACAARCP